MEKGKVTCNNCNSTNTYGISRIVGYYSVIENWNASKQAELVDRQNGNYKLSEQINAIETKQEVIMVA